MNISKELITTKLVAVLREQLKLPYEDTSFPMEAKLIDLGLDSLGAVTLLLNVEQAFGLLFPDSMLTQETFQTAANLEKAVRTLLGS